MSENPLSQSLPVWNPVAPLPPPPGNKRKFNLPQTLFRCGENWSLSILCRICFWQIIFFLRSSETVLKWIGKLKYKEINSCFVFFQWKEQKLNNCCHLCLKLSANAIFTCQINHPLLCYPPHSKKERKYMEKHAKQMSHLPWIRSIDKL